MSSSDSSHNDHAAQHKAYLDGLHLGFNTPDEILIPLIKLATGSDLVRKERIVKGESNEVYEVELTSAHKVILRISRKDRRRFEREQWAMTQCEKAGIPVPNVIYIAALEGADSPSWASVQTKLAGRSIRDIQQSEGISDRRLQSILRKTGEILAIMHGIQTHGFGRIDGEGRAEYETEWDAINPIIENEQLYDLAKEYEIDVRLLEESLTVARERTHEYTDTPRLLHNDLGPDHIFVDEKDELTGLIDFEGASGGDPVADFTHWHFMYRKQLPLEWLMAGYSGESMSRDFPQRLRRNSILKSLFMLPYYHKMQNLNGIRIIKENLEYDLVSKTTS